MNRLFFGVIALLLFSCGSKGINQKQSKIDDLIKKRTEVENTRKFYGDSILALNIPDEKVMEYSKEYRDAKAWNRVPEIPENLYRYWKKLDELDNNIKAFDENILELSKQIDEAKKK